MAIGENLLDGPSPTLLPADPTVEAELEAGADPDSVVRAHPESSLAWAVLADQAWSEGRVVESYAFSRVGYHRGLDALRRNGWKGHGPVPWNHEPNQGFLRCLIALGRSADAFGEQHEVERIDALLDDCDPTIRSA
jgi:hypothetical protein